MTPSIPDDASEFISELDAILQAGTSGGPVATAPPPVIEPLPEVEELPVENPHVLVVDDNKDYRDILQFILREKGYEVTTAADGAEGLQLALREMPNLVLLDFNMPELNGYELVQELRRTDETRKIPIIMFTGASNRHELKKMNLDIQDFLEKPVSNAKLLNAVAKILPAKGRAKAPSPSTQDEIAALEPEPITRHVEPVIPEVQESGKGGPVSPQVQAPRIEIPPFPQAPEAEEEEADSGIEMPEGMTPLEGLGEEGLDDTEELLIDVEKKELEEEESGLEVMANDSPLVNRVNRILVRAVEAGASDIHIEPQEKEVVVRIRINGSLQELCSLPISLGSRIAARVKIMSDLVITERRLPQDGQFRASINHRKTEFRVSTLPSTNGEKIVLRVLGGNKLKGSLGELGFSPRDLQCVERIARTPHGLVLVTGPTGSGKTTTLYSVVSVVNKPDVNVMTAEDPVEYRLPGITQTHVLPAIGLTFESVLRSFLRQDPDVMLVGEIRDLETAEIAVKASITGHLVLSTLHTNSAPATVARLTHMGLAPYLVAASVKLIIAQRLVKVLCPACRRETSPEDEEKKLFSDEEAQRLEKVNCAVGCRECRHSGYVGRKPVFEVMPLRTAEMRRLILANASSDDLAACAVQEGMISLRESALSLVESGETDLSEAMKIILAD